MGLRQGERRQQQRGQNRDNADDDQKFNQSKTPGMTSI